MADRMVGDAPPVRGSIRRRLTVLLIVGGAGISILMFLVVRDYAGRLANESQDDVLTASLTAFLESASVREDELSLDIPYAAFSMLGSVSDDPVFYRVDRDGAPLTGYADLLMAQTDARDGVAGFATTRYRGNDVRVASAARTLSLSGKQVRLSVAVAQGREGLARSLERIDRTAALLALAFFALTTLFAFLVARLASAPLRTMASAVGRRGAADFRPVATTVPQEMLPLVTALNGLLRRLKTSLDRSEDLIAEAAHRVRTPLALVRTHAEIALRRADKERDRKTLREILRAIDESSRAAGQLLDHAVVTFRSDQLQRERIDLTALTRRLLTRLAPLSEMRDIALHMDDASPAPVMGDAVLIESALRNLVENALKYASDDTRVDVRVRIHGDWVRVEIVDEGPGLPVTDGGPLHERFVRGPNAADTVGSGLGLAIAHEVALAHGGELHLTGRSDERSGTCAALLLPSV